MSSIEHRVAMMIHSWVSMFCVIEPVPQNQLSHFHRAASSARERAYAWATTENYWIKLRELGAINERADELLQKILCWLERRRNSRIGSTPSASACNKVTGFFNKIKFRSTIASELKELIGEYQRIALPDQSTANYSNDRATDLQVKKSTVDVVGRDEDVQNIISLIAQLRGQEEDAHEDNILHIIGIVGMPGVGKTTVAQMVYDQMEDSFDVRIWVHSSPPCLELLLRRMAEAGASYDYDDDGGLIQDRNYSVFELADILEKKLRGRKYLLVLDHFRHDFGYPLRTELESDWYDLKLLLPNLASLLGAQGTVIVTATREWAAIVTDPFELEGLSKHHCWQLFCRSLSEENLELLLQQQHHEEEAELRICNFLHEKCYGLPPAVVELAKRFEDHTVTLKNLDSFSMEPSEGGSLSLIYERLPIYWRHCIRFCSLLPGYHNFDIVELGDIWFALDYTPSVHKYFDPLWIECFFQKSDYSADQRVACKLNYFMHQFEVYLNTQSDPYGANGGKFQMMRMDTEEHLVPDPPPGCLHLSLIVGAEISAFPRVLFSLKRLKTLILFRETQMVLLNCRCKISVIPPNLLASLKNLCVLDLQYTMIKKLPRTFGNLLNLRYLNLSETDISTIPKSIGRLRSLTCLKLVNCRYLRKLNDAVKFLVNLQKLDLAGCLFLVHVPTTSEMNVLKCLNIKDCSSLIQPLGTSIPKGLHILPRYIVGENYGWTISELRNVDRLEGELCVEHLERVDRGVDAPTAELYNKKKLKKLTLKWNWNNAEEKKDIEAIEQVLEELEPNKDLIKLDVISYMGKQFPTWLSGIGPYHAFPEEINLSGTEPYLASLEEIKLFNLKQCQKLPPLGILPHLRVAEISGMDSVIKVDDEFYGHNGTFPKLEKLTFSQMLKLEKWFDVNRINMFPCLTNLTIINCPKLVALEMELPSVIELTMWLNNEGMYSSKGDLKGLTRSLKKLSISLCDKLLESSECKGLQNLQVLEEMEISGCQELTNLPSGIRSLNSIKSLTITCCNKLRRRPNLRNDELTSLHSLSIDGEHFPASELRR